MCKVNLGIIRLRPLSQSILIKINMLYFILSMFNNLVVILF